MRLTVCFFSHFIISFVQEVLVKVTHFFLRNPMGLIQRSRKNIHACKFVEKWMKSAFGYGISWLFLHEVGTTLFALICTLPNNVLIILDAFLRNERLLWNMNGTHHCVEEAASSIDGRHLQFCRSFQNHVHARPFFHLLSRIISDALCATGDMFIIDYFLRKKLAMDKNVSESLLFQSAYYSRGLNEFRSFLC
jgi:hypothetical protein